MQKDWFFQLSRSRQLQLRFDTTNGFELKAKVDADYGLPYGYVKFGYVVVGLSVNSAPEETLEECND